MGYETEENWTKLGKLAYKIYFKRMNNDPNVHEHAADWWFYKHPEQFREYYKLAEVQLRNKKIKKILNGKQMKN